MTLEKIYAFYKERLHTYIYMHLPNTYMYVCVYVHMFTSIQLVGVGKFRNFVNISNRSSMYN